MWQCCWCCAIVFTKFPNWKEEHYLRLLQLYMAWRNKNELKLDSRSYEDRYKEVEGDILCNIKKQAYFDLDYEDLQNSNIVQSGEEDNAEFSIINPNFLDLDFKDSDSMSNAPAVSTIIYNLYYFLLNSFTKFGLKVI